MAYPPSGMANHPPIIDIERAGRRKFGSFIPCPGSLPHTAWRNSNSRSRSVPPARSRVAEREFVVGEKTVPHGPVSRDSEAVAAGAKWPWSQSKSRRSRPRPSAKWKRLGRSPESTLDRGSAATGDRSSPRPRPPGTTRSRLQARSPSSGMNSMKRTMRACSRAQSAAKSRTSSSFWPRDQHHVHLQRSKPGLLGDRPSPRGHAARSPLCLDPGEALGLQ